ncbi:hypothetical protein [Mucilaginibacter gynuensis]
MILGAGKYIAFLFTPYINCITPCKNMDTVWGDEWWGSGFQVRVLGEDYKCHAELVSASHEQSKHFAYLRLL